MFILKIITGVGVHEAVRNLTTAVKRTMDTNAEPWDIPVTCAGLSDLPDIIEAAGTSPTGMAVTLAAAAGKWREESLASTSGFPDQDDLVERVKAGLGQVLGKVRTPGNFSTRLNDESIRKLTELALSVVHDYESNGYFLSDIDNLSSAIGNFNTRRKTDPLISGTQLTDVSEHEFAMIVILAAYAEYNKGIGDVRARELGDKFGISTKSRDFNLGDFIPISPIHPSSIKLAANMLHTLYADPQFYDPTNRLSVPIGEITIMGFLQYANNEVLTNTKNEVSGHTLIQKLFRDDKDLSNGKKGNFLAMAILLAAINRTHPWVISPDDIKTHHGRDNVMVQGMESFARSFISSYNVAIVDRSHSQERVMVQGMPSTYGFDTKYSEPVARVALDLFRKYENHTPPFYLTHPNHFKSAVVEFYDRVAASVGVDVFHESVSAEFKDKSFEALSQERKDDVVCLFTAMWAGYQKFRVEPPSQLELGIAA